MDLKKIGSLLLVLVMLLVTFDVAFAAVKGNDKPKWTNKQMGEIVEASASLSSKCRRMYSRDHYLKFLQGETVFSRSSFPIENCVNRALRALKFDALEEKEEKKVVTEAAMQKLTVQQARRVATQARYKFRACRQYKAQQFLDFIFDGKDSGFKKGTLIPVSECVAKVRPDLIPGTTEYKYRVKSECRNLFSETSFKEYLESGIGRTKGGVNISECFETE